MRYYAAMATLGAFWLTVVAGVVLVAAEVMDAEWASAAAAWAMVPLTVLLGAPLAMVVAGFALSGLITALVVALAAWRRCRRG